MTHDRIIVHMVEPHPVGYEFERHRLEWPLHITLVPWFTPAPGEAHQLGLLLAHWVERQQPFTYRIGDEKYFGADESVPVNVIATPAKLATVHRELSELVRASGATLRTEQWTGSNYVPHITHHGDRGRRPGEQLPFDNIAVVGLTAPGQCRIETILLIGGDDESQA